MTRSYSLVPSLPPPDEASLLDVAAALRGVAPGFQIDLVDGQFVKAIAWPFTNEVRSPSEAIAALALLSRDYELEFDCMVCDPMQYFPALVAAGARRVVIHIGSTTDLVATIAAARSCGLVVGVALTNDVPLSEVESLLSNIDFVQLMGIAVVGAQGQPFDKRTLPRAATLRQAHPDLEIAVDGGVNKETIPYLLEAGVNRFAPGSAIVSASDRVEAYRVLATRLPH